MKFLIALLFPLSLFSQEFNYSLHNADLTFSPLIGYSHAVKAFNAEPSQINFGVKVLYRFNKSFGMAGVAEIYGPPGRRGIPIKIDNNGIIHEADSGYIVFNFKTDLEVSLGEFDFYRPTLQLGLGYSALNVDTVSKGVLSLNAGLVNYFAIGRRMAGLELSYTRMPFKSGLGDDIDGGVFAVKFSFYFGTLYFTDGL